MINVETGIPTPVVNTSTGKPVVSNKDGKKDFPDNLLSLLKKLKQQPINMVETLTNESQGC